MKKLKNKLVEFYDNCDIDIDDILDWTLLPLICIIKNIIIIFAYLAIPMIIASSIMFGITNSHTWEIVLIVCSSLFGAILIGYSLYEAYEKI